MYFFAAGLHDILLKLCLCALHVPEINNYLFEKIPLPDIFLCNTEPTKIFQTVISSASFQSQSYRFSVKRVENYQLVFEAH